ncbi:MAG TPA: phosphoribosyltransferase family protein [Promineifilum sp.]|nr:phosphoribosyltransferase family protein [Promineifilum sp.]
MTNPYDYSNRAGVRPISWDDFHGLVKALAVAVASWRPEVVLPVLRGGAYPGGLLAHILQVEVYPVRLTRRQDDVVVRESPLWLVEPPAAVAGRRVLVVDEMCSTGETLRLVRERALALDAAEARTATLYAHTWGADAVDYTGLITDELVLNPWDREIYRDGAFQFHPEYVSALAEQGLVAEPALLIAATPFVAARGS